MYNKNKTKKVIIYMNKEDYDTTIKIKEKYDIKSVSRILKTFIKKGLKEYEWINYETR